MSYFRDMYTFSFKNTYKYFIGFSLFFIIISSLSILKNGINVGNDFTGGDVFYLKSKNQKLHDAQKDVFTNKLKQINRFVKITSSGENIIVKVPSKFSKDAKLTSSINIFINKNDNLILYKKESLGAVIGADMLLKIFIAFLVSIISIMIFVFIRFSFAIALISVLGLFHDIFICMGYISLMDIEFNITTFAAILIILGYSINDTIIVFSKMKEFLKNNKKQYHSDNNELILDITIKGTLKRSILTSFTTILAVCVTYFIGDLDTNNFATISIIGIIFGTYSSLCLNLSIVFLKKLNLIGLISIQATRKKSVYYYNS